jgi:release factor glutamine methyltransferase
MKIQELLIQTLPKLNHLKSSHLDLEVILSYVINKTREYILSHPNETVADDKVKQFNDLVSRRSEHIPVAYLIEHKEFYGRDFYINENVHIPRPATEDMIDLIKQKVPNDFDGTIADIGTGSGIIAITLAHEFPCLAGRQAKAKIIATDISDEAIKVAKKNISDHELRNRITLLKGGLLSPVDKPADMIVANLPYGWKTGWTDDKETLHQPEIVYDGGEDGLELIKKLIDQLPQYLNEKGQAFLEFDPRQTTELAKALDQSKYNFEIIKDSEAHSRILHLNNF